MDAALIGDVGWAEADTLTPVSPTPHTLSIAALALRYRVRKPSVTEWLAKADEDAAADPSLPAPPEWSLVEGTNLLHVDRGDWDAYETARRAAGLPMPGERRGKRGPTRARRDGADGE